MLTYNMDVEERSTWLRATPGAAALAQPFYCTEAGNFYGRAHFATARTDKESYLLFYTLSGSGLIEQNDQRVELPAGSALPCFNGICWKTWLVLASNPRAPATFPAGTPGYVSPRCLPALRISVPELNRILNALPNLNLTLFSSVPLSSI